MDDIPTKIHVVPIIPTNVIDQHVTDCSKQLPPCLINHPIIPPNRDKFESEKYDSTYPILDK